MRGFNFRAGFVGAVEVDIWEEMFIGGQRVR